MLRLAATVGPKWYSAPSNMAAEMRLCPLSVSQWSLLSARLCLRETSAVKSFAALNGDGRRLVAVTLNGTAAG